MSLALAAALVSVTSPALSAEDDVQYVKMAGLRGKGKVRTPFSCRDILTCC